MRLLDEWISGRHAVIQRHYKRGHWQQLDKLIYEHNYRMNDLSHWPFDGACIFADGNCACFLGSLKAASSLHEFHSLFGREVTVVVSLCAQDQCNMRGAPEDWSAYFESMEVRFLSFAMQDLCVSASADALTFYNQARHTVDTWLEAATQLVACFEQFAASGRPFHVLFHCVGGINRSSGMLAAWLVIAHGFSAEDAIDRILQVRPSLRPWRRRDYVLWLLGALEQQIQEVRAHILRSAQELRGSSESRARESSRITPLPISNDLYVFDEDTERG